MLRRYKVKFCTNYTLREDPDVRIRFVRSKGSIVIDAESMKEALEKVEAKLKDFVGNSIRVYNARELIK